MKPIVEKMLKSGLLDKRMVELLERMGCLPPGSVALVNEDALKNATDDDRRKLAEDLEEEAEKEGLLNRESMLDMERMRWPTEVSIYNGHQLIADNIKAMVDRMGRYFFRIQDVVENWFVPGFSIRRELPRVSGMVPSSSIDTISDSQTLYSGSTPVAVMVTVMTGTVMTSTLVEHKQTTNES